MDLNDKNARASIVTILKADSNKRLLNEIKSHIKCLGSAGCYHKLTEKKLIFSLITEFYLSLISGPSSSHGRWILKWFYHHLKMNLCPVLSFSCFKLVCLIISFFFLKRYSIILNK